MERRSPADADATRDLVFAALLSQPQSRTQLAEGLGFSQSTVTKVIQPLIEHGYVQEAGDASVGVGRPRRMLQVNKGRHSVVGIKLAPGHITGVLVDLGAEVLAHETVALDSTEPHHVLGVVARLATKLVNAAPPHSKDTLGIGVGLGGHVDTRRGVSRHSYLMGWHDVDVRGPLEAQTGLPVVVSNDVNSLVVAEQRFGEGRGLRDFAVVTVGAGVGCGLLLGGELFDGWTGIAGELGHIPVVADGELCSCGNRGCLETVASEEAILAGIKARGGPRFRSFFAAASAARDPRHKAHVPARESFQAAGQAVGWGIATLLNLLNLQKVIVSGEAVGTSDLFGEALRQSLSDHAFSTVARDCDMAFSPVDDTEWARGAACLVIGAAVSSVGALSSAASRVRLRVNGG